MSAPPRIIDVVFEQRRSRGGIRWAVAGFAAVLLHVLIGAWGRSRGPSLEDWSAQLAVLIHAELSRQDAIEVARPQPPPSPIPPPPEDRPVPPARAPTARSTRPPPPARAGAIVAQAPRPDAPVDLTGDTFVTGGSKSYAGGVTSSSGTNPVAVHTEVVDPRSRPTRNPADPDLTKPVTLEGNQWQCPWPREADSAEIDQQFVVLRVLVNPSGSAEKAELISDPGHGFGAAAVDCALKTRFEPAKDRQGRPVRALSPPIRVRFTR
jgi:protein TonB